MKTWSFDSPDPEATHTVARLLGRAIGDAGLVIALVGPLGAGKTAFVKGLAEGLGVPAAVVSSPTFVIAQQYPIRAGGSSEWTGEGPHVLHHVDLYRLESELELDAIGFEDLFSDGAVLAVEWADRFPGVLGAERLEIELDGPSGDDATRTERSARVTAFGAIAEAALEGWVEAAERASRAGGAPSGGGAGHRPSPRARCVGLILFALSAATLARFDGFAAARACMHPVAVASDALGTSHVDCGSHSLSSQRPTGIGGLLYGDPIELNMASALQLEALPGIGPTRAQAIVDARRKGRFESLRALERVHGIGPKTVDALSRWLVVETDHGNARSSRSPHG